MRRARGTGLALALAAIAVAAGSSSASASTLGVDPSGVLRYTGALSEANHVRLWYDYMSGVYAIQDTGVASITVSGRACGSYTPQIAYCSGGKFSSIDVHLGDAGGYAEDQLMLTAVSIHGGAGADTLIGGGGTVTLDGGGGYDTLTAGSGTTRLTAGPGGADLIGGSGHATYEGSPDADAIHARNGVAESISCGDGTDTVEADPSDTVAADCETVDRGTSTAAPAVDPGAAGTTTTTTTTPAPGPLSGLPGAAPERSLLVAISRAPVALDARGRVPVALSCPGTAASGCDGIVVLSLPEQAAGRNRVVAARRGRRVVGRSGRFKLAAGQKAVVPVRMSRRGARVFRARGRSRRSVKLDVAVTMRTDAGVKTTHATITVKARRRPTPARRKH